MRVGIVADDLTGAADSLVQFRSQGWESHLLVAEDSAMTCGAVPCVVSRSLDSRSLANDLAAQATAQTVSEMVRDGFDRVYVKVDSTMRGSIPGQIRGALDAWSRKAPAAFSVICPAYPGMGRVIVDGKLLVKGVPLQLSPAGSDPVDPVRSSELADLVPGAKLVRVAPDANGFIAELRRLGTPGSYVVVEAQREEDMQAIARAIDFFGSEVVPVGSAGLAGHLAGVWRARGQGMEPPRIMRRAPGRVVVAVTSVNEVSLRQADRLMQDWPAVAARRFLDPGLGDRPVPPRWARDVAGLGEPPVLLLQPRPGSSSGGGARASAPLVARSIATAVREFVLHGTGVSGLVLVGGDGARAVLAELGAQAVRLEGTLAEGVPWGRLVGGVAAGKTIVTKAGGFGEVDVLSSIVSTMIGMDGKYQ
ncbi:four-carbon acid sugar kinase family protein [Castellaniella sp.]|uniref:four-carbon acid sugar kinase family protein n=1 Tax=Castellaniella sp. TaxID=1955812 RepID=UPI0025C02EC0|nr:four-carbon acid sugar kinase family protein [Castellaniella sp.]